MKIQPHITILVCAVLFTVLSSTSCKDKNKKSFCEENPSECQTVAEAKDYFLFKQGSWWVYEEETSHERDSMYVTAYLNNLNSYDFDCRIKSNLTGYEYHYSPFFSGGNQSCSANDPIVGKCLYVNRSKGKIGDYVGEGYCFFVNTRKGDWAYITGNIYFDNNKIIVEDIFNSYSLSNMTFGKTIKIHELSTRVEGIQPTNHYFTKNIGLIRKELLDSNQIWNLVDYHIEL